MGFLIPVTKHSQGQRIDALEKFSLNFLNLALDQFRALLDLKTKSPLVSSLFSSSSYWAGSRCDSNEIASLSNIELRSTTGCDW